MTKKVIPFPQAALTVPPVVAPQNRIILNIGKHRIAMDISGQTRVLNPVPAKVVRPPAPANGPRRQDPPAKAVKTVTWERSDITALHSA
jgi:hypothetical protein